jgi:hypothetical protein
MLQVSFAAMCARRRGALAGGLTALLSIVALTPCLSAAASSQSHSHHSHGSGGSVHTAQPTGQPGGLTNWLTSADGTLNTAVGTYTDCTGAAPVPTNEAAIDTCMKGRTYFVGHNAGVFTPLMHMAVGSLITWYDSHGRAHRLRVVAVRVATGGVQPLTTTTKRVDAQFQTCINPDGSVDRVLDAVSA